jgi:hypothetical protein
MIVAAAIKAGRGMTCSMPKPCRHVDIQREMEIGHGIAIAESDKGFLDDRGRFLGRHEAAVHACAAGQVKQQAINWNLGLFSEDLW